MTGLTNKEIKRQALERLKKHFDIAMIYSLYMFTIVIFIMLCEVIIFIAFKLMDFDYHILKLSFYRGSVNASVFLAVRIFAYYMIYSSYTYIIRRLFIGLSDDDDMVGRYIFGHLRLVLIPALKSSFKLSGLKLLVMSPLFLGVYGIVHYSELGSVGQIDMFGLVCFMLSIGFSIVWTGICAHYFMSLSLVKYILELNPRTNFFDACDLSVRLMEGKHYRVMMLYISFIQFLPAMLLVYPCLLFFPYFIDCRLIMAKEIMGTYWQDKLPAIARRWEKQQKRK